MIQSENVITFYKCFIFMFMASLSETVNRWQFEYQLA